MKTEDKEYCVIMSKFKGYSEDGSATYEITFNKSLEHTGRFKGIEDGLNGYVKKESKKMLGERRYIHIIDWRIIGLIIAMICATLISIFGK